jgi:methionine synthase II (cobalamin-independent)
MEFQGKEIPEEEFRALARRAFRALLREQDQIVLDTKAGGWFTRSEATEQQMFADWLNSLGVKPFPFREFR